LSLLRRERIAMFNTILLPIDGSALYPREPCHLHNDWPASVKDDDGGGDGDRPLRFRSGWACRTS
jgi:hypothetical protein